MTQGVDSEYIDIHASILLGENVRNSDRAFTDQRLPATGSCACAMLLQRGQVPALVHP